MYPPIQWNTYILFILEGKEQNIFIKSVIDSFHLEVYDTFDEDIESSKDFELNEGFQTGLFSGDSKK